MSFLAKGASVKVLCGLLVFLCLALPVFGKVQKNDFYYASHAQAQKMRDVWVRPFTGATEETRKMKQKGESLFAQGWKKSNAPI
jgi:hypothetical protein